MVYQGTNIPIARVGGALQGRRTACELDPRQGAEEGLRGDRGELVDAVGSILTRYFESFDDEVGVTASRLRRFGAARQWPYVRHWFRRMFEDPANETPRPDGKYEFIWGGPYDALEQLQEEFLGFDFERLSQFAERLEREGGVIEWAPGPAHPDHQRAAHEYDQEHGDPQDTPDLDDLLARLQAGAQARFGDPVERFERAEMLRRLDALDAKLEQLLQKADTTPGLGHNQPPLDLALEAPGGLDVVTVGQARIQVADIRRELQKQEPDALVVAQKTSLLRTILFGLAGGAAVAVGKAVTAALCVRHPELVQLAADYIDQAALWLHQALTAII